MENVQVSKSDAANKKALGEARTSLDDESRVRAKMQGDNRNMQAELDQLRDQLEVRIHAGLRYTRRTWRGLSLSLLDMSCAEAGGPMVSPFRGRLRRHCDMCIHFRFGGFLTKLE